MNNQTKDITKDIMELWPFPYPPRQNQINALQWIQKNSDKTNFIIELPVGGGKSNLAITASMFFNQDIASQHSYILTPQRILQKQYEQSFIHDSNIDKKQIGLASLYGKSNYDCTKSKKTPISCEMGGLLKPTCGSACPHTKAKDFAKKSKNTVLNYKLALTSFAYTATFAKRKLMVFDECHTLENWLVDFDALSITYRRCKKYDLQFKIPKTIEQAIKWIHDYYLEAIGQKCSDLFQQIEHLLDKPGTEVTRKELNQINEYKKLQEHADQVTEMSMRHLDYVDKNFVLVKDKTMFQFKRIFGKYSYSKYLKPKADKFLFMSSTILNKKGFCQDLGLDPDDTVFLSLPSEFDVNNRPVYYLPITNMNRTWNNEEREEDRQYMLQSVVKLLNSHKQDSGIIHTGNFAISQWLVQNLQKHISHTIYHHNPDVGDDRNAVINAFMGQPSPSVLISPSCTEGLDLKDDLGRFAIFVKVPYLNLGDAWVKRRMQISGEWYQRQALINTIQGGGRIVRSETDKGTVYILDGTWQMLFKKANDYIPIWWKNSYQQVNF